MNDANVKKTDDRLNPDPITGEPGSHPIGTGLGAAGAGAAGAAIGTIAGPVGTAIGAAVGALAGGLIGKGAAELVNPTEEDAFWRERCASEPYYDPARNYDDYAPAYRAGYMHYTPERTFEESEPELKGHYQTYRGKSQLEWEHAKPATHAAWKRRHEEFTLANSNVSGRLLS